MENFKTGFADKKLTYKHVQILTSTQIKVIFSQTKQRGFFLDYICKILLR